MDRETLEHVWRAAERARGRHAIDFAFLVETAAEIGPISWRDVAELALRAPREEAAQPIQLLEVVAELAHALRPNINRLKMLKRQMFGRASLDLLRKRVLLAY